MGVRKFRSVEDIPQPWLPIGDTKLYRAIESVWALGQKINQPKFPPGVYKHRSIEDKNVQDEQWAKENFDAFWRKRAP